MASAAFLSVVMSAIALCNWPVLVDQHCGIMTMLILHSLIGWRLCPVNRYTLGTEGRCRIRSPLAPGRNMLAMTRTRSAYFAPGRLRCALFIVCFCIGPPRKRALRRAIGRAARNPEHTTMYKERPCTLRTLTGRLADPSSRPAPRRRSSQPDCHRGPRLKAMTWNTGGLSSDAWLELQIWLHEQEDHDVIFLQETLAILQLLVPPSVPSVSQWLL